MIESRPEHTHMPRPPVVPARVVSDPPPLRGAHRPGDVVRITVRGRSVALPGMRVPPAGVLGVLAILGPGLVAALAGDDAGGIATYSATGAQFGYDLLWVLIPITIALAVVQEMCGRLGAASGRGLLDLIRERFGIGWALLAVVVVLLANGGVTVTEFVGLRPRVQRLRRRARPPVGHADWPRRILDSDRAARARRSRAGQRRAGWHAALDGQAVVGPAAYLGLGVGDMERVADYPGNVWTVLIGIVAISWVFGLVGRRPLLTAEQAA
jgi:hypothetical protein